MEYYHHTYEGLAAAIGPPAALEKVEMYKGLLIKYPDWSLLKNCQLLTSYANPAPKLLDRLVSVFYAQTGINNKRGEEIVGIENTFHKKDLSVRTVTDLIRGTRFAAETEKLRQIDKSTIDGKKANSNFKKTKFCYATWSCTGTRRKGDIPDKHSGLICIDVDGVPEKLPHIQAQVNSDPWTVLSFISPNGDGLKVLYEMEELPCTDPEADKKRQKEYYLAYSKHVAKLCNIPLGKIDQYCSNVGRACFLPSDPSIFINPDLL